MPFAGSVTFVLTDVEGSTRLWERCPEAMRQALPRHDALAAEHFARFGGTIIKSRGEGDSLFCVFADAGDAVRAALALQCAMHAEAWPGGAALRIRVGVHTGPAESRDGDYYGATVNRCARLRAIGHGGQTLLSRAARDAVSDRLPAGASVKDLGTHRLKDLLQPEHVFQVVMPPLPDEFPPLRSLQSFANNLPVQLTTFIGRARELQAVAEGLTACRLRTLTGPGGCGKTRLAVQLAAEHVADFADGVWLVDLAAVVDEGLVTQTVAAVLGVRPEPQRPLSDTLAQHLASRQVLLLLDNCEHVLGACATMVAALLAQSPELRVLATSREPLGIAGESVWPVPSLDAPEPAGPVGVEHAASFDAVRLFVDRAVQARPDFALREDNADALARICWRLDGIPLAIELAAARVRLMSPRQILDRLEDRFRLLTGGSRTARPRQQTLRALIDWSYDLLSGSERTLLHRLAVFVGGWSLEASQQVCADEDLGSWEILDLLGHLVDKSLVQFEEGAGEARYRLLETMRQYALEKLEAASGADLLRERHSTFYLAVARAGADLLRALGESAASGAQLFARELGNIRAGMDWAAAAEQSDRVVGYAKSLFTYLWQHSLYHECEARLSTAEAAARQSGDRSSLARLLNQRGLAAWDRYDLASASARFAESRDISHDLGERDRELLALVNLGNVAWGHGDFPAARQLWEEALALAVALGEPGPEGMVRMHLGILACERGDHAAAEQYHADSMAIRQREGDELGVAFTLYNASELPRRRGLLVEAEVLLGESRQRFERVGNTRGVALADARLALVLLDQDRATEARARAESALRIGEEAGDRACRMYALSAMARLHLVDGDAEAALHALRHACAIAAEVGDAGHMTHLLLQIAGVMRAGGRADEAYVLASFVAREQVAREMAEAEQARAVAADVRGRLAAGRADDLDREVAGLDIAAAFRRACPG
ncbi:MAG: tetratricopeptide repeat protein [Chthonomonadales bacterium]|nr:tetratricopeptide repeat protein [Chthonomonadales bacterium]